MRFLPEDDPRRRVWESCESPIEQYLCCALFALFGCRAVSGMLRESRLAELANLASESPTCFLFAQHPIVVYRVDFLLISVDPQKRTHRRLVIECDGERYHGSEDQIARDQQRDEEIQEAGFPVIRYTGAALHREMRKILGELKGWIKLGGAVCEPASGLRGYADLLFSFTPDAEVYRERAAERRAYWDALETRQKAEEPDFMTDRGEAGWWRDTL